MGDQPKSIEEATYVAQPLQQTVGCTLIALLLGVELEEERVDLVLAWVFFRGPILLAGRCRQVDSNLSKVDLVDLSQLKIIYFIFQRY